MTSPADPVAAPVAIRTRVRAAVDEAWQAAVASGALPAVEGDAGAPTVEVERPANAAFGDLATNLAMKLARPLRRAPLDIAEVVAASLQAGGDNPLVVVGGGRAARVREPARGRRRLRGARRGDPRRSPTQWGRIPAVNPRRVNVEFVSANPTGPLTVGNARGAFVGDLLCRVLEAGGQSVTREYYFNDSGAQVDAPRRLGRRGPPRRAGARGRLQGRVRRDARGRAAGRGLDRGDRRRREHRRRSSARGLERARARGHRGVASPGSASGSTSGRARPRSMTRAGSSARSSGCATPATSTSRTARSGSARPTSVTTRTG